MNKLNINIFTVTTKVVIWLFLVFNLGTDRSPKDFYPLLRRLDSLRKTRGIKSVVSLLKDTRVVLLNYLSGNPIRISGVKSTKDCIPIILGDLVPIIRREPHPDFLRVVTTIFWCTRALSLGKGIDLQPIISPALQEPHDISKFVPDFWKDLGYRNLGLVPRSLRWRKCHLSTKVGPNSEGDNALYRAMCDLSLLPSSLENAIRVLGGSRLSDRLDTLYYGVVIFRVLTRIIPFTGKKKCIRTLSVIKDKELKNRVIAIGDYWSQTALIPFHEYLFRVLKKIPQDCTFDQSSFISKILNKSFYYSADLVNATDRFPIKTISSVMLGVLPKYYIDAWENIMVGHPFDYKQGKKLEKVSYSVGNPMGFYSSWASFSVAHHYVIYYCCRLNNIDWKTLDYALLGDDIVICNPIVAASYKEVISKLGVEISKPKTYTSTHLFEFAKRIFYKGVEISPFPISGLKEVSKKYYLLTQFFIEAEKKGWISLNGVPTMVATYLEYVLMLPSKFRNKLIKASTVYEHVQRIVQGAPNAGKLLSEAYRILGYPFQLSDFVALNVLENIAVDLFASSNPFSNWKEWTETGKINIFKFEIALLDASFYFDSKMQPRLREFISSLPIVDVVSNLNEMAKDSHKEAIGYSNSPGGKWPLLLKTMAYPISADILVHRSSYLISRTVSKISKMLLERGELLSFYPPEELLRQTP